MINCKICNKQLKSNRALAKHIVKHNVTSQEYYDKFMGFVPCPVCGKKPRFLSIGKGYCIHCSISCGSLISNNKINVIEKKRKLFSDMNKKNWQNNEYRNNMIQMKKNHWENIEYKTLMKKSSTQTMTKTMNLEVNKKIISESLKYRWNDNVYRDKMSKQAIDMLKDNNNKFGKRAGDFAEYKSTGIFMRSQLERKFAKLCDENNILWQYEPKVFMFNSKDKRFRYLPDFYLPKQDIWIEVKPCRYVAKFLERDLINRLNINLKIFTQETNIKSMLGDV